ncbi:MAG: signal peptidase I [Acidobacteria bacterium]|nr:MAG: signal peptidase I [Acidobacteriota bacterium]
MSAPVKAAAASKPENTAAAPPRAVGREYFEALLIAAIFLGFTNNFLIKTFYIPSGSMEDTLLVGDHLFVNRFIYGPARTALERRLLPLRDVQRGDVVIFRSPKTPQQDLVKRCVGLPGDTIRIVDKVLFVNGRQVDDSSYAAHRDPRTFPDRPAFSPQVRLRDNFGPFTVPEDHYFFLGDNRDHSYDSRYWGAVPRHLIKGRALLIYWSYGGQTPDGAWHGWRSKLVQIGRTATGFVTKTRWSRTFHLVR